MELNKKKPLHDLVSIRSNICCNCLGYFFLNSYRMSWWIVGTVRPTHGPCDSVPMIQNQKGQKGKEIWEKVCLSSVKLTISWFLRIDGKQSGSELPTAQLQGAPDPLYSVLGVPVMYNIWKWCPLELCHVTAFGKLQKDWLLGRIISMFCGAYYPTEGGPLIRGENL